MNDSLTDQLVRMATGLRHHQHRYDSVLKQLEQVDPDATGHLDKAFEFEHVMRRFCVSELQRMASLAPSSEFAFGLRKIAVTLETTRDDVTDAILLLVSEQEHRPQSANENESIVEVTYDDIATRVNRSKSWVKDLKKDYDDFPAAINEGGRPLRFPWREVRDFILKVCPIELPDPPDSEQLEDTANK